VFEVHTEVKRKSAVYGVAAILLALLLGAVCYNFAVVHEPPSPTQPPSPEQTTLQRFSSYTELVSFLEASLKNPPPNVYFNSPWGVAWDILPRGVPVGVVNATVFALSPEAKLVPTYSPTNIQVAGVDEADIVKTDGTYLYVASNNSLYILEAYPPEEAEVLSTIGFNGTLGEIFLDDDKLAVLGSSATQAYVSYYRPSTFIDARTLVNVYDISDRSNPVLTRNFSISGNYFDSRRINEYIYLIASQPSYLLYDTLVLPKIYSGDGIEEIGPSQIYYANVSDNSYAFTTVVAINIQNDTQDPTHKTFLLGSASCMYVSLDNIYITFWTKGGKTLIYRIRIEDEMIKCEAWGEVPGSVLNQFSMDEYNGYFRLATTDRTNGTSKNNVYVLDMELTTVGKLENIAPRETIHSARFMGNRCYLVTFKKIDPLFVIDLENPSSPEVLGWLKITGYSDYLQPYDENHIIGIGKETEAAEQGDFAWYQGVKISLFDVSNVSNPVEINKHVIGDRGTESPVLSDHKALLFDKSKNLLVIPVLVAEIDPEKYPEGAPPYAHGDYVWQGAYVFNITLDEGLVLKGGITHLENGIDLWASNYWVKRSLYIEDVLYTISDKKVMMHNLETLDEINKIEL
jgi:inhibitor of cysteine peptidase